MDEPTKNTGASTQKMATAESASPQRHEEGRLQKPRTHPLVQRKEEERAPEDKMLNKDGRSLQKVSRLYRKDHFQGMRAKDAKTE